jgi:hypothetical protein
MVTDLMQFPVWTTERYRISKDPLVKGSSLGWNETSSSGVVRPYGFKGLTLNFREDSDPAYEKAFLSILADSICESIHDTMGKDVLSLLVSKGFLDDMANPRELDKQLSSVFGNASLMLERIIIKGLYLKLSIPYDSNLGFYYSNALDVARNVFLVEIIRE